MVHLWDMAKNEQQSERESYNNRKRTKATKWCKIFNFFGTMSVTGLIPSTIVVFVRFPFHSACVIFFCAKVYNV